MHDSLPAAELVHAMAGRTRLRVPSKRDDTVFFASVLTGLSTLPGVRSVEAHPLTGSILIYHDVGLPELAETVAKAGLVQLAERLAPPSSEAPLSLDPKLLLGIGLGALALWQVTQGRVLPRAGTLAWYAANLTGLLSNGASKGGE
jgi:hypothetical protein